jgi:hypothetical protein
MIFSYMFNDLEYLLVGIFMVIIGVASGNHTGKSGKSPNCLCRFESENQLSIGNCPGRHV